MKNKTVLITGGTSGIGLATAKMFIGEGATVIITGRHQETIDKTVDKLGDNAYGFVSDAGKMSDIYDLQKQVKQIIPNIDVLFVNAGIGRFAPVENVTEELFDKLFNLYAKGTFFTVQQLLPLIGEGGSVILNTSVVTEFGFPNLSVYSAAKAAVQSFIRTFAAEYSSRNIRVNGVSPGYVSSDMINKTGLSSGQIDGIIESTIPTIALKRFGEPEEVAEAVGFLASDEASYIHGTEIIIDGGLSRVKTG